MYDSYMSGTMQAPNIRWLQGSIMASVVPLIFLIFVTILSEGYLDIKLRGWVLFLYKHDENLCLGKDIKTPLGNKIWVWKILLHLAIIELSRLHSVSLSYTTTTIAKTGQNWWNNSFHTLVKGHLCSEINEGSNQTRYILQSPSFLLEDLSKLQYTNGELKGTEKFCSVDNKSQNSKKLRWLEYAGRVLDRRELLREREDHLSLWLNIKLHICKVRFLKGSKKIYNRKTTAREL